MSTIPSSIIEAEEFQEPEAPLAPSGPPVAKSPGALAWARMRADKKSMAAAVIVVIYLILGILAPILVKTGVLDPSSNHLNLLNDLTLPKGRFGGVSWAHPFGVVPGIGYDVLSRVWYGITFSLAISISAAIISVVIGVVLGIIAGVSGGWVDSIIGRFIDLVLCFPQTLMLLSLSATMLVFITHSLHVPAGAPAQALYVTVVMAAFGWTTLARLIRGQVLSLREREFVEAARLFGASQPRLWFKEMLPNLWAPILVNATLMLPLYISTEAALAFLGVSINDGTPTLGNVLRDSINYPTSDLTYFILPAAFIAIVVVAFNLLGDGLRDALDPKSNR